MSEVEIVDALRRDDVDKLKRYATREKCDSIIIVLGYTPVRFAAARSLQCLRWMIEEMNADTDSVLHTACHAGNEACIKYLVEERKMDVDQPDLDGLTPLYHAHGKYNVVRYLLSMNPKLSQRKKVLYDILTQMTVRPDLIPMWTLTSLTDSVRCLLRHGTRMSKYKKHYYEYKWAYDYQCELDAQRRLRCARSCAALLWALRARGMPKCLGGHMVRTYVLPTWLDDKWDNTK